MEAHEVIGWVATIVTFCLFTCGIPICVDMIQHQDSKKFPFLQFLFASVNTTLMAYYGYLIKDDLIFYLNISGIVLHFAYVLIFLCFTKERTTSLLCCITAWAALALVYTYMHTVLQEQNKIANLAGLLGSLLIGIGFTVPLPYAVRSLVKREAFEGNFPMTVISLFVGGLWLSYGLALNDFYICLPNIPALSVSAITLIAIARNRNFEKDKKLKSS